MRGKRTSRSWGRVAWVGAALLVVAGAGAGASAVAADLATGTAELAVAAPSRPVNTTASTLGGIVPPRSVTLLTGDRVVLDPAGQGYRFHPAVGRERMSYQDLTVHGRQYVIPGDARLLVASGKLDARLFEVSALLAKGTELPLMVTDDRGTRPERVVAAAAANRWAELTEPLPMAGGARFGSRRLRAGVHSVTLDGVPVGRARRAATTGDSELTFVFRDRAGAPTADASTVLLGIDDPDLFEFVAPGPDGVATVRIPHGRYHLDSTVDSPRPGRDAPASSVIVHPELTVEGDTTVEIAAAVARPVTVTVPDPAALGLQVFMMYLRTLPTWKSVMRTVNPDTTALYTGHAGSTMPDNQLVSVVGAFYARPGPTGTVTDSPVSYAAGWHRSGRMFTGLRQRLTGADLSTVRVEHGSVASGRHASRSMTGVMPLDTGDDIGHGSNIQYTGTPFTRVERYAGTITWANRTTEYAATDDPDPRNRQDSTVQIQTPTSYRPGRRYLERWNLAPFWSDPGARRAGDRISVAPTLFNDQAGGRQGISAYRRARLALYRDGQLVGESDRLDPEAFTVPAGRARYTLTAEAERGFTELASRTSTTWTFTSERAGVDDARLPLLSVRYTPPVDLYSRAPAARPVSIPVRVERSAPGAALVSLTVEVSFDGGATWRPAPVRGHGDQRIAVVHRPAGNGPVSLRARAADAAGGTVEQTTINAYRIA